MGLACSFADDCSLHAFGYTSSWECTIICAHGSKASVEAFFEALLVWDDIWVTGVFWRILANTCSDNIDLQTFSMAVINVRNSIITTDRFVICWTGTNEAGWTAFSLWNLGNFALGTSLLRALDVKAFLKHTLQRSGDDLVSFWTGVLNGELLDASSLVLVHLCSFWTFELYLDTLVSSQTLVAWRTFNLERNTANSLDVDPATLLWTFHDLNTVERSFPSVACGAVDGFIQILANVLLNVCRVDWFTTKF